MTEATGWDFENGGGSDNKKAQFTKFPEGITRIRVVDEAPYQRWTHWITKYGRSVTCPGRGCPICEIRKKQKAAKEPQTYNIQRKLSMNIINRETGNVEVMEQGKTFFEDLRDLRADAQDKNGVLKDFDLKVRRRGTQQDNTSYRIDLLDDAPNPLTSNELQAVEENRMNFVEYYKPHTPEQIKELITGNKSWEEVVAPKEEAVAEADEVVEIQ